MGRIINLANVSDSSIVIINNPIARLYNAMISGSKGGLLIGHGGMDNENGRSYFISNSKNNSIDLNKEIPDDGVTYIYADATNAPYGISGYPVAIVEGIRGLGSIDAMIVSRYGVYSISEEQLKSTSIHLSEALIAFTEGTAIGAAGDLDGDGLTETFISPYCRFDDCNATEAYVIKGSASRFYGMQMPPEFGQGFTLIKSITHYGDADFSDKIRAIGVGDVTGDKIDDLAFVLYQLNSENCALSLLPGKMGGYSGDIYLDGPETSTSLIKLGDGYCQGDLKGGDIDGDGVNDIVAGMPIYYSMVKLIRGGTGVLNETRQLPLETIFISSVEYNTTYPYFMGAGIVVIDINGDECIDIGVASPGADEFTGAINFIPGSRNIFSNNITLPIQNMISIVGKDSGDFIGTGLTVVGNVTEDKRTAVAFQAFENGPLDKTYVVYLDSFPEDVSSSTPSNAPSVAPTLSPSLVPSAMPTAAPSIALTLSPSAIPTKFPITSPSIAPADHTSSPSAGLSLSYSSVIHIVQNMPSELGFSIAVDYPDHVPVLVAGGDGDGDGLDDLLIGNRDANDGVGEVYSVNGRLDGFPTRIFINSTENDWVQYFKWTGVPKADAFGISIALAKSVSYSGFADMILGSATDVHIIRGPHGQSRIIDLPDQFHKITSHFGSGTFVNPQVFAAGDLNNDQLQEIAIVQSMRINNIFQSIAYIVNGNSAGISTMQMPPSNANGFSITTHANYLIIMVQGVADVTGDGIDDLGVVVNVDGDGTLYLLPGGISYTGTVYLDDSNPVFPITAITSGLNAPYPSIASGDIDGDGFNDFIIGGTQNFVFYDISNYTCNAEIKLFRGGAGAFSSNGHIGQKVSIFPASEPDCIGSTVIALDVDKDKYKDIGFSDPYANGQTGAAYFIPGNSDIFSADIYMPLQKMISVVGMFPFAYLGDRFVLVGNMTGDSRVSVAMYHGGETVVLHLNGFPEADSSSSPSEEPTASPSAVPSVAPTLSPSVAPSATPTAAPSSAPIMGSTAAPTVSPSAAPSVAPTLSPSMVPSVLPSAAPTVSPSVAPSVAPTLSPSVAPSVAPTLSPSMVPTVLPSAAPTVSPSVAPSVAPTVLPSATPTVSPSAVPTVSPSIVLTTYPSDTPTTEPTVSSTLLPSAAPTAHPTTSTMLPTTALSSMPTLVPTEMLSTTPTIKLTFIPTTVPTIEPSTMPTLDVPSALPIEEPTIAPSELDMFNSAEPSLYPTQSPESDDGLSGGEIAGVAVGGFVGIVAMAAGAYYYFSAQTAASVLPEFSSPA